MDPTVTVALIGVLGTLLAPILAKVIELVKISAEESKEERGLQRAWLRDDNVERYDTVKKWVIEVMKVIDPAPIAWRPDGGLMTDRGFTPDELNRQNEMLEKLNARAAEVKVFASCDEQLAQHLQAFIDTLNSLGESRDPDKIKGAHSAAARVINRAYELVLQVPKR